ncbi:MAG TPA: Zn-dependent alcohol dehydrogenase [Solirubrobacteraceae bacterium]|jgi:S-(hydroxymethyl)glutathione dehydrogenase/alcohol dehydrogenase|nr:Zn-dependent alcohol dehydrogenase [Solirubrobacteraceae bacterium]
MRMKAAVLSGPSQPVEVRDVDLAEPKAGEVLVKIGASGLCGSDLNALDGKRTLVPFPAVLGHEAAGVVEAAGDGVESVSAGDHVVITILPSCGQCVNCLSGRPNHCLRAAQAMSQGNLLDGSSRLHDGEQRLNHFLTVSSFAEYAVVGESNLTPIDSAMPLDRAALIGCAVLTGFGAALRTARVKPGDRVAVFGCGGVGLSAIQGARIAGAQQIIAVDVPPSKLELARAVGATHAINPTDHSDVPAAIGEVTDHHGVDHALEAAGRSETIEQAWQSLAVGGMVTVIGTLRTGTKLTLDAGPLIEEKRISGCYLGGSSPTSDIPELVTLYLDGELQLDELVSRRIGLSELNHAFGRLRDGTEARQVVVFDGSEVAAGAQT